MIALVTLRRYRKLELFIEKLSVFPSSNLLRFVYFQCSYIFNPGISVCILLYSTTRLLQLSLLTHAIFATEVTKHVHCNLKQVFQFFIFNRFLTACRISLIRQQYTSGFKHELMKTAVVTQMQAILTALLYPINVSTSVVTQNGREKII